MSHSACPHCGSTNSIETAGQRYCADCGQLISTKKDAKDDKKKETAKAEKKTVNKPEAKPKTVSHAAPAKPRHVAPPLNLKAIEESRGARSTTVSRPGALDLRHSSPKAPVKKTVGKHVAPAKTTSVEVKREAVPVVAEAELAEVRGPVASTKTFHHKLAFRDGFRSLMAHTTFKVAFIATLITTICEAIFVVRFAKTGMYAITESISAGSINAARAITLVGHLAWASLLGFIGYLVYHYAMAYIVFRTSRSFDRRPATAEQAHRVALGSLSGLVIIDLLTWMFAVVSLVLVVGANVGFLGTKNLGVAGLGLAMLTNAIVAYIWLGLIAARHMTTYAIVLGQVGVRQAYSTGWALYNRQFARITTGLILVVLVSFIVALPASILHNLIGGSSFGLTVATIATAATQAVLLVVGSVYFLRLYRFVIAREYDSELGHLLSGRQPQKTNVGRRLAVLAVITLLWVIISTALIINASPVASAIIR